MNTETKTILFLHILAAMWLVAGILGYIVLYLRARRADDIAEVRATLGSARAVERWLATPGAGLVGIFGLLLMWRYSDLGIDVGKWTWLHISIVLWLSINIIGAFTNRATRRAVELAAASGGSLADVRAALSSGAHAGLLALNALITLFVIYLMVFQPFVRE